jgi:hypothetical protein
VGSAKSTPSAPVKRTMSAAARKKIAAFQRARWAKIAERKLPDGAGEDWIDVAATGQRHGGETPERHNSPQSESYIHYAVFPCQAPVTRTILHRKSLLLGGGLW